MTLSCRWVLVAVALAGCTAPEEAARPPLGSTAGSAAAALQDLRARFVVRSPVDGARLDRAWLSERRESSGPFLPADAALGLSHVDGGIAPTFTAGSAVGVHVTLPARGDQPISLTDGTTSMRVDVGVASAAAAPLEIAGGCAVAPSSSRDGGVVVLRPTPNGVEDFVLFERAPAEPALAYDVHLIAGVAGLRLVSETLELVDAGGAPRLRMAPPRLVDAHGAVHRARVRLVGCDADTDASPPWGRRPVAPRASSCRVVVDWRGAEVAYPALLDPAWMGTSNLAVEVARHAAALLADGRVLVTGGDSDGTILDLAQVYDPATNSWAATAAMANIRLNHRMARLDDSRVLVCGGLVTFSASTAACESWSPATGTWTAASSMGVERERYGLHTLGDGRVLALGGLDVDGDILDTVERYDPALDAWSPLAPMNDLRFSFSLTELDDGRLLVAGGFDQPDAHSTAEIFNPATGAFTIAASMSQNRGGHEGVRLPDGRVLVAGGITLLSLNGVVATALAEIFDPAANVWASIPALPEVRYRHTINVLQNGFAIVTGGQDTNVLHKTPRVYDAVADAWLAGPDTMNWRVRHTSTLLADGTLLLAGGEEGGFPVSFLDTAERLVPGAPGEPCTQDFECASAQCVDGVCCDTACGGPCEACTAMKKGGGADGTCGPVASGSDPDADCEDSGALECQDDGTCDGAGACKKYGVDRGCMPLPCAGGPDCASGFCVEGICCDTACDGKCEACTTALKASGVDGQCGPIAKGTDPEEECGDDGSTNCEKILLCNGAGACQLSTEVCAPYTCLDASGCKTKCSTDSECAPKHRCKDGTCVLIEPECDGDVAIDENGVTDECPPYACDPGTGKCREDCVSVADCAAPNVCADGECVPPPPPPAGADGGCGCRVPAGSRDRAWVLLASGLAAWVARRRTRGPRGGRLHAG